MNEEVSRETGEAETSARAGAFKASASSARHLQVQVQAVISVVSADGGCGSFCF